MEDSRFTVWEAKLQELGLLQLELIQREVRLRCIPPGATAFHTATVGPYASLLICFSLHLSHRFGTDLEFAFPTKPQRG